MKSPILAAALGAALMLPAVTAGAPLPLTGTLDLATDADLRIDGAAPGDRTGFAVAALGDVNGDKVADFALGADHADPLGRKDAGSVFVVFGRAGFTGPPIDLGELSAGGFRIDGAVAGDEAGFSVAPAGDVNGDGLADVVLGAPRLDIGERKDAGAAYIVFGSASSAPVDLAALGSRGRILAGAGAEEGWGFSVAGGEDVDGDGHPDVVVGSPRVDTPGREGLAGLDTGAAAVVFGAASSDTVDLGALGASGYRLDSTEQALAGWSVGLLGDVTGDHRAEVLVGGPFARPNKTFDGAVWVSYGKAGNASVDLGALGDAGYVIRGTKSSVTGGALAPAGDLDGDGLGDILVGAQLGGANGLAHVVYSRPGDASTVDLAKLGARGFTIAGALEGEQLGAGVAGLGDYNGDGREDVMVGAPFSNALDRPGAGAVYIVFGKAQNSDVDLTIFGNQGIRIAGADKRDLLGRSIAGLGDANGDGRGDLLLGGLNATGRKRDTAGSAFVVLGPAPPPPPPPPLPPDPGANEEVTLDHCHSAKNIEFIIDDSGSMSETDPDNLRAEAMKIILRKERNEGESVGAVEFGSDADELFPPLVLGGTQFDSERGRLFKLIDERIGADSGSTNYNAAFEAALHENAGANAFVFLTDGAHNEGPYRNLHHKGPKTFVVGLGIGRTGFDAGRLQRIADHTGGHYYPSVDADELAPVMNAIDSRLNCDLDLSTFTDVVTDTGEEHTVNEDLDEGTYSSEVLVSWDDEDDAFALDGLTYTDDDGDVVARISAKSLRKAARGQTVGRRIKVTGDRASTSVAFRITGVGGGHLRARVRATKLHGRGSERVTTQVTESRRRR